MPLEDESYSGGSQGSAIVRKWLEYNHQWAGLIVLVAGLLALVSKFQGQRWAGRVTSEKAALVFPALCTACGALLLTHTHATGNIREELYAEMSHTPIALLGATAGWGRWLKLRGADGESSAPRHAQIMRVASWIWPLCLIFVGLILLNCRES